MNMNKIHGNSKYHNILTKEFLEKEYILNKKTTVDISKQTDCPDVTIGRYLKLYNIPIRNSSEAQLDKHKGNKNANWHGGKPELNCSFCLKKIKVIKCRIKKTNFICCSYKCANKLKKKMLVGQNNPNYIDNINKEFLIKEYVTKKKTIKHIANFIQCDKRTISKRLDKYKIKKRSKSENMSGVNNPNFGKKLTEKHKNKLSKIAKKRTRENNPNWKNGRSFEPYPLGWNKTFKEQIRYRDGYKCQLCGCGELENGQRLCVHHIDYNKDNLNLNNLLSLCRICHNRTNGNRDYWINYFKKLTLD